MFGKISIRTITSKRTINQKISRHKRIPKYFPFHDLSPNVCVHIRYVYTPKFQSKSKLLTDRIDATRLFVIHFPRIFRKYIKFTNLTKNYYCKIHSRVYFIYRNKFSNAKSSRCVCNYSKDGAEVSLESGRRGPSRQSCDRKIPLH